MVKNPKMSLWTMWEAFFGVFCLFSKLFGKGLNQNLTYSPVTGDPESRNCSDKRKCSVKQESVYLDSHFLESEKDGKLADAKPEVLSRPVHETIEMFDKPNDIETSLPRYQNKTPRISDYKSYEEDRRKILPVNMEKLRDQLEKKLKLQKCKSDFHFRSVCDKSDKKTFSRSTENGKENWETDRKTEKEKHNCLLKVNLSKMSESGILENGQGTLTRKEDKIGKMAEMQYLRRAEKNGEYGGGWECHRCGKRVYHAERMLACGNAYHKNCFSCVKCRKLLGPRTYLEADMEIYCSHCHAKNFGLTGYGFGLGPGVLQTSP